MSDLRERLRRLIADRAGPLGVPGVAVGVAQEGERFVGCHGVTSTANPLPVDETTLFAIGSVTKTVTATAVMRLVERGAIDLAAPVKRYVPELRLKDPGATEHVTMLHLLNHTAGWEGDRVVDTGRDDGALAAYVARMAEFEQVMPLGSVVSYNNAALSLAGRVVEKVTGTTYEAAVRDLVLGPLGLGHSFFDVADIITRRFVVGHGSKGRADGPAEVVGQWLMERSAAPAGGLFCGIGDLLDYGRFHLGGGDGVLEPGTLELMRLPSTPQTSTAGDVGISWFLRDVGGVGVVEHTGGTTCGVALLTLVPEHGLVLAVLANSIGAGAGELLEEIRALVLEDHLGAQPEPLIPARLDEEELAELVGVYDRGEGHLLVMSADGDRVTVDRRFSEEMIARYRELMPDLEVPVQEPITLVPLAGDAFHQTDRPGKRPDGRFVRVGGKVVAVEWSGRVAPKIS
ncbi:serine hydrolase domain-containing protein [Nonomuraea sp. M3C6]|uniref:Serine hydrolase domain-containing protein n=1 Tax=Nonomuraea marmarensis TaxID=3351344 RepID=A0ABW7AA24_9ACTN